MKRFSFSCATSSEKNKYGSQYICQAEFEMPMQEAAWLNESMVKYRVEIERLKLETKVLASETGKLKTETRFLLVSMSKKL